MTEQVNERQQKKKILKSKNDMGNLHEEFTFRFWLRFYSFFIENLLIIIRWELRLNCNRYSELSLLSYEIRFDKMLRCSLQWPNPAMVFCVQMKKKMANDFSHSINSFDIRYLIEMNVLNCLSCSKAQAERHFNRHTKYKHASGKVIKSQSNGMAFLALKSSLYKGDEGKKWRIIHQTTK